MQVLMIDRCRLLVCSVALLASLHAGGGLAAEHKPLALHPENGHYFLFRGKPTVIVTSAEHYGAVLNLDFDYVKYLDELAAHGLNNTRTWAGAYCEDDKSFNIARNTLAPAKGRFICPWARSDQAGYPNGGNKFDLTKWDEAYFKRLKDFLTQASQRGVIVEMVLFCPFYEDSMWKISPQNAANNVNDVGRCQRTEAYTLDKNGGLLAIQKEMTRKIVRELNEFDNLYYDLQRAILWRRDDGLAARHCRYDRRGGEGTSEQAPDLDEYRQRQRQDRKAAPGRERFQLSLRQPARGGGRELPSEQGHWRQRDRI
jgi:hypothetical protein